MTSGCPMCGDPFPCLKHGKPGHTLTEGHHLMRSTRTRAAIAVAAALLGLGALAGCDSKTTEPFKDAPRSHVNNGTPMDVVRGSDGFSNVGTKCDHGNRLYVAYHGDNPYAAVAVVPQDPTCH
ncbi:hypothetical protein [Streptomyces sp. NPDC004528]|uniref:hypothetical protein n=1 Tax=Streptomyces sp. NPDC004528 TaxID=3154550 RepID=UPI0033AAAE9F